MSVWDTMNVNWDTIKRGESRYDKALAMKQADSIQKEAEKRQLQDAVKKAVITAKLEGKIGGGIDVNSLMSGGSLPDLNNLQINPDVDTLYKKARLGKLTQELEGTRRMGVMADQEAPSAEDISQFAPTLPQYKRLGMNVAGGGMATTPQGTTLGDGRILGPAGEQVGEYLPGYEPKEIPISPTDISGAMREKFAPGIGKEELARETLGLPKAKTITKVQSINNTNKVMNNIQSKQDLQELIDNREAYEAEGVDVDKIIEASSYLLK